MIYDCGIYNWYFTFFCDFIFCAAACFSQDAVANDIFILVVAFLVK